jgi:hypothetical protein
MMKIDTSFDCNQKEFIEDLCWIIYGYLGYAKRQNPGYFFNSQHPTEKSILCAAEEIFQLLTGDRPDYEADED